MKADAIITMRTEYHPDPLNSGSGYATHTPVKWEGGPIAVIPFREMPHIAAFAVGDRFTFGPWLVVVIALGGFQSQSAYVTRDLRWAWWYAFRFWAARHWRPFKCRVIATCAVWGLAKYEWNAEVSWSEIYAVAWLKARLPWLS